MNFHLDLQIKPFTKKVHYQQTLFFIGSCFAENMALQMQSYKFNTVLNPHGVLYNPDSMAVAIRSYLENKEVEEKDLFYANHAYHSWQHHSRFSNTDKTNCLYNINQHIHTAHQALKTADWLFITFGSAYVYNHKPNGLRVGNCHKQPLQDFIKELLEIEEMLGCYQQLIAELLQFNPELKILFTVSPVRYIRDGVVENNRSKARLLETVHRLTDNEKIFYFPAYELIMDDLRDYRFYKTDLVHPNDQAIEYVFQKLIPALFDQKTAELFEKIKDILKARSHRVMSNNLEAHRQFRSTYLKRCEQLQHEYPFLSLKEELAYFGN